MHGTGCSFLKIKKKYPIFTFLRILGNCSCMENIFEHSSFHAEQLLLPIGPTPARRRFDGDFSWLTADLLGLDGNFSSFGGYFFCLNGYFSWLGGCWLYALQWLFQAVSQSLKK